MTTELAIPKKINPRWLQQKRTVLDVTAKTNADGTPNKNYANLKAEIDEAAAEFERWQEFEGWVKAKLGLVLNAYPHRDRASGLTYDPGQVFLRKDKATGRVEYLTRQDAWEAYTKAHAIA